MGDENRTASDMVNNLPASVIALLLSSVFGAGFGVNGFVQPRMEESALKACYDNSRIAIDQADSQGRAIEAMSIELLTRTRNRFTDTEHETYAKEHALLHERAERQHERVDEIQDREIEVIQNHISGHIHEDGDGPVKHEHEE